MPHSEIFKSYQRVDANGSRFYDAFYRNLMAKDPIIKTFFRDTDMERQYQSLAKMVVYFALNSGSDSVHGSSYVTKTIELHNRELQIPKRLFTLWQQALLETLAQFDPEFTPELSQYWQEAMTIFTEPFGV